MRKWEDGEGGGGREGGEEEEGDQKKKSKVPARGAQVAPYFKLFSFADPLDYLLMILGTIGSIGNGMTLPIMTLILGGLINAFGDNQNDNQQVIHAVSKMSLKYVYLGIGAAVASYAEVTFWVITGERQAARIRSKYLKAILRQDVTFFDKETSTGEVVGRMAGDTVLIQDAIGEKVGTFQQYVTTFVGGFVVGFIKQWKLTLVIVAVMPLLVVAITIVSKKLSRFAGRGQEHYAAAGNTVQQVLGSMRTVAAYTGEAKAVQEYDKALGKSEVAGIKAGLATGVGMGFAMLVMFGSYGLALWYGSILVAYHGASGGSVVTVIFAALGGGRSLGQAGPFLSAFAAGQAAAYKMFEVIERTPPIDTSDLRGIIPDTLQGEITLKNIDFSYPARPDVPIFTNFNLTISPGTTVALVGESGSGKSTVVSLIQRFYDPNGGAVLVDGIDIKTLQLKWLRQQIGLVSQEPVLFSTTIRENIAYGKDGATDKEIQAAAVRANAANFINKMPEGYETQVGEAGIQLSGGQKQRVAIARAILKNPGILLLDEATSALDAESERVVQDALEHIMVGRTTVVVAHRLTTIRNANVIAVLQRGNIVETGTHTELLRNPDGAYSQLVRLQQIEKQQPEEYRRSMGEDNQFPESVDQINSNTSDIITRSVSGRISSGRKSATSTRHSTASLPRVGISSSPDDKFKSSFKSSGSQQRAHHEDLESSSTTDAQGKKTSLAKKLSLKSLPAETSLFRLAALNKPEFPFFILGSLAAAGTGLMFPISGLLISNFISAFFLPNVHQLRHEADKWGLVYGLMAIGIFFVIPIQYSSFGLIGQRLIRRVRRIVFERIVRQEVAWFDKDENGSGSLGARLSTDAASVRAMVGDNLALVVQNLSTIVCGLSIAFSANWELSLLILAMVPLLGMQGFMQVKFSKGFSNDAKVEYQDASRVAGDAVSSIRTVASFCAEDRVVQLYEEKCKMPLNSGIKQGYISGTGLAFSNFVQYACSALAFWVGAILVKENKTTFGDVFKVFFAITMSALAVSRSTSRSTDLTKVKSAVNSIFEIIDTKSKIDPLEKSGQTPKLVRGEVELRHVGFAYPRRPTLPIFKDLNLTVQAGKTMALVGESGSGKSTVISLIERFYDPDSGVILLDGIDIKQFQVQWLRQQMGLVSQEPVLFNISIKENITYGRNDNVTETEVEAAAKASNAHKFITSLPDGFNTLVGEKGVQLSGGQKQRIAIARAIIKDPKLLLLDEATSALDAESERVVQEALDRVMQNRTTVVVAHRLSTIQNADMIAVVKNGAIMEQGTHRALLANKGGTYSSLVRLHLSSS
ncbi:unnamed protein product [Sphagnum troendelagicum]|uniref:Uncharacterized protein n=1 Tax=Sphagnum troendelagicum TaxID=128251 RepID=A0ABP0TNY5_9BRYO